MKLESQVLCISIPVSITRFELKFFNSVFSLHNTTLWSESSDKHFTIAACKKIYFQS